MSGKTTLLAVACALMVAAALAQAVYVGSPAEGRVKREATTRSPQMWMELRACCALPPIVDLKNRTSCFPALGGTPPTKNHSCFVECSYRKQGLLNAAGTAVDSNQLGNRITTLANADSRWTAALNAAAAACITPGLPPVKPTSICKSGAAEAMYCINTNLFQRCPDVVRNSSPKCKDLLSNVGKN